MTPIERLAKALHEARERQNPNAPHVRWEVYSHESRDRLMAALSELVDQDYVFLGPASLYEEYHEKIGKEKK